MKVIATLIPFVLAASALASDEATSASLPVFQCRVTSEYAGDSRASTYTLNAKDAEIAVSVVQVASRIEVLKKLGWAVFPNGEVYAPIVDVSCKRIP